MAGKLQGIIGVFMGRQRVRKALYDLYSTLQNEPGETTKDDYLRLCVAQVGIVIGLCSQNRYDSNRIRIQPFWSTFTQNFPDVIDSLEENLRIVNAFNRLKKVIES